MNENENKNIRVVLAVAIMGIALCGAFNARGVFFEACKMGERPTIVKLWLSAPFAASYYASAYWFGCEANRADMYATLLVSCIIAGCLAPLGLRSAKWVEGSGLPKREAL
jgi:hypothetical protein